MPSVKENAYEKYMEKVKAVKALGFKNSQIIAELKTEICSVRQRAIAKSASLRLNRSPYPAREVIRASHECITAIQRIVNELTEELNVSARID